MTGRDNQLWLQMWRDSRIEFHLENVNPFLIKTWSALDHKVGSRVFVPLCGKSQDMLWLAEQGYQVVGIELSPVAVKAFFKENGLKPVKRRKGKFMHWTCGNIDILCGDYFSLSADDLGHIDKVYDRAALTALPEDVRKDYILQLRSIVPKNSHILLLTIEDIDQNDSMDTSDGIDEEVTSLYSEYYEISLADAEIVMDERINASQLAPVLTKYKAYQLSSKSVLE